MESENLLFDKLSHLMIRMHVKEIMLDVRKKGLDRSPAFPLDLYKSH